MNEIQLFLAVMLSFKSSKGLIFFSMIFFEHTTVLVTFFRSFLFFFFCFTGMVYFEAEIAEAEGFFWWVNFADFIIGHRSRIGTVKE